MLTTNRPSEAALLALVRRLTRDGTAKRIREEAHLSLDDIGRSLGGVAASTVMRWERGSSLPRSERALRYGALLAEIAALEDVE